MKFNIAQLIAGVSREFVCVCGILSRVGDFTIIEFKDNLVVTTV